MIISQKIYISRILDGTWRSSIFIAAICIITYIINEHVVVESLRLPVFTPTILGTALAFFIGFNNNQAYDRWWEGRKIWGSLVNDSRTWARQIVAFAMPTSQLDSEEVDSLKKKIITRHIAFLYILKENLRNSRTSSHLNYISDEDAEFIKTKTNKHNALLDLQTRDIQFLYHKGVIDGFQFMEINKIITRFCDEMGKAERIKNTVFPTTYSYYTNVFIWIFIIW